MNGRTRRRGILRLLWLLLMTASAIAAVNCLVFRVLQEADYRSCLALSLLAGVVVASAWRYHQRDYRRWTAARVLALIVCELFVVSFAWWNAFPQPTTPEERQYYALQEAIRTNDARAAETILANDYNPNFVPKPLNGNLWGIGIQCTRMVRSTPIEAAVFEHRNQILAALFNHGASLMSDSGYLLGEAARERDITIVQTLLAHGARVSGFSGSSPALWYAVRNNDADMVALLLKAGANPNTRINNYDYPSPAVRSLAHNLGYTHIEQLLKQAGAAE